MSETDSPQPPWSRLPGSTRISGATRRAVIERDGKKCTVCGKTVVVKSGKSRRSKDPLNHLTLDHIVPLSTGGTSEFDNLRVCCRRCNMKRNSAPPPAPPADASA